MSDPAGSAMFQDTTVLSRPFLGTREGLIDLIRGGGIESYVQPIVDLFCGEVFGYEMLARGTESFRMPDTMFQAAEDCGLVWELEYECRSAALRKIASLPSSEKGKFFFINVSPLVFSSPDFQSGFTMAGIRKLGLGQQKIVLEITEKASIEDYSGYERMIRHYIQQGFHIALDDFGSGHSGLVTLVATTPHFMKIDRSLVAGVDKNAYKQNLVKSFAAFAENVGSSLLAEGIETMEELKTMLRLGARYAQGFLFGRPTPEPASPDPAVALELKRFLREEFSRYFAVDTSIFRLFTRPETRTPGSMTCAELDDLFRGTPSINHLVVVDKADHPLGLVSRQYFNSVVSGRYGFSIFQKRNIEDVMKRDVLIASEGTDLRVLEKLAMERREEELYEPVIVTDSEGALTGTITMKQLLAKAFDMEIKLAACANPLTGLPGNMVINVWLDEVLFKDAYTLVYADLDHFKEYNDVYGFSAGDRMIRLTADILSFHLQTLAAVTRLGHIGGDDFILLTEELVGQGFLEAVCSDFDERREELFPREDVERGSFLAVNRAGKEESVPLVTLSLAVVSSENFKRPPHPGRIGQVVAYLKHRVKAVNAETRRSGFLIDRRTYDN
jgi:EAL domain-containing protein (putative c-di-GMP-specific phosphodiesterase class I)/GGDEF domain-containing protein